MDRVWSWFRSLSRGGQVGVGCGALMLSCLACGSCALVVSAMNGNTSAPTAQATTAPTATTVPTATPDQATLAAAYAQLIVADIKPLSADSDAISTDCGNADLSTCRADAVQFQGDIAAMQADIAAHPAPRCLAAVDKDIRAGLLDFADSAAHVIAGIDANDPQQIDEATSSMATGSARFNQATAAIPHAVCK